MIILPENGGICLGNHAKIVPKKIKIGKREEMLEAGDLLIVCTPEKNEVFLENLEADMPEACLVKIFRVEDFDVNAFAIWQTSEGICIKRNEAYHMKSWGYDGTLILERAMDLILEKMAPLCLEKQKPSIGVIKQDRFKTTVSTLTKKLVKKD